MVNLLKSWRVVGLSVSLCVLGTLPVIAQQVEKKVTGKTYVFDYDKKKVYNKNFSVVSQDFSPDSYTVKKNSIIVDVFRSVMDKQRIEELRQKNESVLMFFICKADGRVEYVNFFFRNGIFLTPEEVSRLEDKFLSVRFPVTIYEPGVKRVAFGQSCRFSTL